MFELLQLSSSTCIWMLLKSLCEISRIPVKLWGKNNPYYMASSMSGQDEPNRVLWLATRAGKMEPSCPLGTTRCIPQAKFPLKPYNKSFIDQVCSVKMAGYWPRFLCKFMDLDFVSVHKHANKELGQYPAILTSHLVNNPYLLPDFKLWRTRYESVNYGISNYWST